MGRLEQLRYDRGRPVDRKRRMDTCAEVHASRLAVTPGRRSLDDRTWADLNLDNVFAVVDRTASTLGQHALYHRLRTTPVGDRRDAFEALVTRMDQDILARERAQIALQRLQDPQGYDVWWLGRPGAIERPAWYAVFPLLTTAALASFALAPFWPVALLFPLLVNLPVRYITDRAIGTIARSIRQCAPLIATAASLRFLTGHEIEPIVGPLASEVPRLARLKWISNWANANPFTLSVDSNQLAIIVSDFIGAVYEYLNVFLLLDATGMYFGLRDLNTHREALVRVAAAAGEIDAAISVASFREGRKDWTRPQFRAQGEATLTGLCHPLIADTVPNSIGLRPGSGVLVTGSNMSGKSTFLRTVGVNVVLAQTLNTCLAREYLAPVFDVRSCIGRLDDLMAGKSYYIVEVEALLGLVRLSAQSTPHLFLLDELFRGTNAIERIAAGEAVLRELVEGEGASKPHVVIAATHDGELVDLLPQVYDAYHFGDAIGADGLVFDHRLQPGRATTRTAIALLRQYGAPERLVDAAIKTAARLDHERSVKPSNP